MSTIKTRFKKISDIEYVNRFVDLINQELNKKNIAIFTLFFIFIFFFGILIYAKASQPDWISIFFSIILILFGWAIKHIIAYQYPKNNEILNQFSDNELIVIREILYYKSKSNINFSIISVFGYLVLGAFIINSGIYNFISHLCCSNNQEWKVLFDLFIKKNEADYIRDFFWAIMTVFPFLLQKMFNWRYELAYKFIESKDKKLKSCCFKF